MFTGKYRERVFATLLACKGNQENYQKIQCEIEQLREVLETFDQDYKQGNKLKLTSDFKNALKEYGDGENSQKLTVVQSFLKKLEDNGEQQAMEKLELKWHDFKMTLGKHYNPEENNLRMAIFESNELATEGINKKYEQGLISYKVALNEMADLTDEEIFMMNGLRINETSLEASRQTRLTSAQYFKYDPKERVPDSVDWRKKGYVTSVKYQGECGSCYAFTAVAALEGYHKRMKNRLIDLSPQNALDCTWKLGNKGCSGGLMNPVFDYARQNGISTNMDYPYVESEQRCLQNQKKPVAFDKGFMRIEPGDEMALKHAVAKYGPIAIGINGSKRDFRFYKSGVYTSNNCGPLNHAVLLVGYGRDPKYGDYWIVKNSWGTDWGLEGYIHMARNKNNMCHIASLASFPI